LSTVYWIISIVYIFIVIDMWRDKFGPGPAIRRLPNWLGITIVLPMVNVSVHYRSRSHSSASIPELTT
jgi:hypothetical protein